MRADQADLFRSGRRPVRGGVFQREAAHADEVHTGLLGVEDGLTDVDLDIAPVRIDAFKLRPDRCGGVVQLDGRRIVAA